MIADFLVQTTAVAERKEKRDARALLLHGFSTLVTHLALLTPFMSWTIVAGIAVLSAVHTLFDAMRIHLMGEWGKSLSAFFLDQGLHVATILALFVALRGWGAHRHIVISYPAVWMTPLRVTAVIVGGYVLNMRGGSMVVRKLLQKFPKVVRQLESDDVDVAGTGRTIGILERFLIFTLVLFGQWAALGFVVAAKSIARFRELENQTISDYYLIGTLASILVALATGILVRAVIL